MKKACIAVLVCFMALTACQKDSLDPLEKPTAERILGKWMLIKYKEETYNASNAITYSDERIGDGSDSLVFKPDGKLFTYSNTDGNEVIEYKVINEMQLRIEQEDWKIATLNNVELHLVSEEIDPLTKEKDIVQAFLKRP